jgi:hypothetical protein
MPSLLEMLSQQLSPEVVRGIGQQLGADEKKTGQAISALLPMMIGGMSNNLRQSPQNAASLSRALERDHDGSMLDFASQVLGNGKNLAGAANVLSGMLKAGGGTGAANMLPALLGGGSSGGGDLMGQAMQVLSGVMGGGGGNAGNLLGAILGSGAVSPRAANGAGILEHILGGRQGAVQQGVGQALGLDSRAIAQLMAILAPMVMGALGKMKRQQGLDARGVADVIDRERQTIEKHVPEVASAGGLNVLLDSNRDGKVDLKDDIAKVGIALGSAMILSKMRQRN